MASTATDPTTTVLRAVDAAAFGALGPAWRDVESRTPRPHYAETHAWLSAWIAADAPQRRRHVEVREGERRIAVGLLERAGLGRLRFAGAPVSPRGGLVVADGREIAA